MDQKKSESSGTLGKGGQDVKKGRNVVMGLWGVRYQTRDVARSVAFNTQQPGFKVDLQRLPAFAQVSVGGLKLILSGPGASGSRPMPGGGHQEPGGRNRVILQVADLPARIAELNKPGSISGTTWRSARAESRYSWKILTAIQSSCSSRLNSK